MSDDLKLKLLTVTLYALAFFVLFGTWAATVFFQPANATDFVGWIRAALYTLGGHALAMISPKQQGDA